MVHIQFLNQLRRISFKHLIPDVLIISFSMFLALYLRVGLDSFVSYAEVLLPYAPAVILIRVLTMVLFGCYSVMWRYVSTIDAKRLGEAIAISTIIIVAMTALIPNETQRLPRSLFFIDAAIVAMGLMGIRLYRRLVYEGRATRTTRDGKRTFIYGAGENGRLIAKRLNSDPACGATVIGFIDDDPLKKNAVIADIPVMGDLASLSLLLKAYEISQLIVAVPNLTGDLLREIVQIARPYNIRPRITGSMSSEAQGGKMLEINREIDLADLLNRPRRDIDLASVKELVRGKRVLVTGAGGSIGSELARQIMSHDPGRVLLLDSSEYNLYEIDKELRLSTHDTQRVVPLMIDLKDAASLRVALLEYAPEVVFHAAAYKHVHLVESNPGPSILNNVQGTRNLLEICKEIDVSTFVMISTDKAVNPAGVMGATKRVCELMVTAAALETGHRYCSTRFGNVLGSSGSLIPLLKKQIEDGGPVTITHQDMTRYFMLIPEAVSLVLKAATIARPGDINVLRMGEPIKIVEVARSLIALMGKTEDEIPVVFTGLRPGEKMFEELYIRGDELKTEHPDILTLPDGDSNLALSTEEIRNMYQHVDRMVQAAVSGQKQALFELNELVKSRYSPSPDEQKDDGNLTYLSRSRHQH